MCYFVWVLFVFPSSYVCVVVLCGFCLFFLLLMSVLFFVGFVCFSFFLCLCCCFLWVLFVFPSSYVCVVVFCGFCLFVFPSSYVCVVVFCGFCLFVFPSSSCVCVVFCLFFLDLFPTQLATVAVCSCLCICLLLTHQPHLFVWWPVVYIHLALLVVCQPLFRSV